MADRRPQHGARSAWGLPALLLAALGLQYFGAWRVPFINDDFVFLDLTRRLSFPAVWAPHVEWVGRYYRPWSRELHYWALQRLFGAHELPFHLVSFALWAGVMTLYFLLVRKFAGPRAAGIATACVAALAAWALPILWIAGAQDLWMMLFALACLLLLAQGRLAWATLACALALLSKETAALLPGLALVYAAIVEERKWRDAVRRTAPLLLLDVVWLMLHPQFGGRLWSHAHAAAAQLAAGPTYAALRTVLATFNLDRVPWPERGWGVPLLVGVAGAVVIVALVLFPARRRGAGWDRSRRVAPAHAEVARGRAPDPARVGVFALGWALAGWVPLFMPSVGWHAYYALFGMLGAWLLLSLLLERRLALALGIAVALAMLRSLQAYTVSRDWGDEWYQRRAAEFLVFMRHDLLRKAPAPEPHSRLFFMDVPSNVGFLQGDAPALRVWYRDPTLSGGLFAQFTARSARMAAGPDRFFRYDSTAGWIEVRRGEEDVAGAQATDLHWREDHERLAAALARGGDWSGTAAEYEKLAAAFPDSATYLYYAGLAQAALGDAAASAQWIQRAAALPTADAEIHAAARALGEKSGVVRRVRARRRVR